MSAPTPSDMAKASALYDKLGRGNVADEKAIAAALSDAREQGRREGSNHYEINEPVGGYRKKESFTDAERRRLWPIAETLAMLDGNAFFTSELSDGDWWASQYLPEADALYQANGGDSGWAGSAILGTGTLSEIGEAE